MSVKHNDPALKKPVDVQDISDAPAASASTADRKVALEATNTTQSESLPSTAPMSSSASATSSPAAAPVKTDSRAQFDVNSFWQNMMFLSNKGLKITGGVVTISNEDILKLDKSNDAGKPDQSSAKPKEI